MPPSDRRSQRKTAVQRSIAAFVCVIVFLSNLQTGNCQPAVGDAAGNEKPAASGIDALEVVKVVRIPRRPLERLRVMSIDVPANVKKPSDITVRVNTIDDKNKTRFLPVGDDIPGTKFKIKSYKKIEENGVDASEIPISNKDTGAEVVLPLKKIVDLADESYCIFHYKWVQPGERATPDFLKRRGETFVLPPEADRKYKVMYIGLDEVVIELQFEMRKTLKVPK